MAELSAPLVAGLAAAVWGGLHICSPIVGYCNSDDWLVVLRSGAQAGPNLYAASNAADSRDLVLGWSGRARMPRPDRYYGLPVCRLTDGQLLAYDAACSVIDTLRGSHG